MFQKSNLGSIPTFDTILKDTKAFVDRQLFKGINAPLPIDIYEDYNPKQHKLNHVTMQKIGM